MSIPGLGNIQVAAQETLTRTVALRPAAEWRFEVSVGSSIALRVLSGTAEKDGVELALRTPYTFSGIKSKILTWHGCELQIDGPCEQEHVADFREPTANPATSYINLHAKLDDMRQAARRERREGPRILIAGPSHVGKTTLARTLTSYCTRAGGQPIVVNADPSEGMLSFAGTLSAGVFATIMDPEAPDGWGTTPTSGPSSVPVKLPLVYYFGKQQPDEDPDFYRELSSKLASAVSGRLSEDEEVKSSGVILDTAGLVEDDKTHTELLAHVVDEFSVNIVVVLGSPRMHAALTGRFMNEKTSLGEPIQVISLDKSDGAGERSEALMQRAREATIKEYFFGDGKRTLSPQIQQVETGSLVIYSVPGLSSSPTQMGDEVTLVREQGGASSPMEHWALAVMHASPKDPPDVIRAASVMGFVYVSDVDEDKGKVKVLAPVSGRLGDRPLVWGMWPEPFINLLG